MIVRYSKRFTKQLAKQTPKIQKSFFVRIDIFIDNPYDPILKNHALKGKWLGYRSINVTGDMRAIFKRDSESALFVTIDSHSNLYS